MREVERGYGSYKYMDKDYNVEWGQPLKVFKGHSNVITSVKLTQDGKYVLSSSRDGTLRLWDLKKGFTIRRFVGHSGLVCCGDISHDLT